MFVYQNYSLNLYYHKALQIMFDKLTKIQDVLRRKEQVMNEEKKVSTPTLKDYNLIPQLYKWFCESLQAYPTNKKRVQETTKRRGFLFVVLYIYSPKTIIGGQLPDGMRDVLASTLHPVSKASISNDINYLYLYYTQYSNFRRLVEIAYSYICKMLGGSDMS